MNYKHGMKRTIVYNTWSNMKGRCENPNDRAYSSYGGRGIKVCERWQSFENFFADMGHPPAGHSLERKDNDQGYNPDNCVWADRTTQNRNKRSNRLITVDGETQPMSVWAERCGISTNTLYARLRAGWEPEAAVKTPKVTMRKGIPWGEKLRLFAPHDKDFHELVEEHAPASWSDWGKLATLLDFLDNYKGQDGALKRALVDYINMYVEAEKR